MIKALGLYDGIVIRKYTPSESKLLVKNINSKAASGAFSYNSSVVGMLLYLSGHTRPDIAFMFSPKHLHEFALKRIGCCIKQISDHGKVMNPSSNVCKIDAYPSADFEGMYGHEDHTDPTCAKSRLDYYHFCRVSCVFAI